MADGRNNRQLRVEDGPGNDLFVEGPEIFQASASPGDKDQINALAGWNRLMPRIEHSNGVGDLQCGAVPLDPARCEDNFQTGMTPSDDVQHIANGRPRGRRYESD